MWVRLQEHQLHFARGAGSRAAALLKPCGRTRQEPSQGLCQEDKLAPAWFLPQGLRPSYPARRDIPESEVTRLGWRPQDSLCTPAELEAVCDLGGRAWS